jgi:hypothetical protein
MWAGCSGREAEGPPVRLPLAPRPLRVVERWLARAACWCAACCRATSAGRCSCAWTLLAGCGSRASQNASVLHPDGETLVPDQAILVQNERIAEIGPLGSVRSSQARAIDVHSKVLTQGLIDCHLFEYRSN